MQIFFIRHAESQANMLHEISNRDLRYGLTMQGRDQVTALARLLESQLITRIYSSPVLRVIETSILLASQLGVEYEISEALREYDCGILEGRSDAEAHQAWKDLFDAWVLHKEWERRIEGGRVFTISRLALCLSSRGWCSSIGPPKQASLAFRTEASTG